MTAGQLDALREKLNLCPAAGSGVHSWILGSANSCRICGVAPYEAERLITERLTRKPSPANEVKTAVAKAYSTAPTAQAVFYAYSPKPITEVLFEPEKLKAVAAKIEQPSSWRHWLWERSPKRPETQNAFSFLLNLYRPEETVLIFDKMESGKPSQALKISNSMDCTVPESLHRGGTGEGVWFLCNPVDGQWHANPRNDGKSSCRSAEAVSAFRYAVLESDQAPADQWLAFVSQLEIKIAAIYTSGGRSIHCLVRLDAKNKLDWDATIAPLKRPLKVMGADPACLSAIRLTRLPGCARPNKNGFQKLLYLCPNPPLCRLIDLPTVRPRAEALNRWKELCPRWDSEMEAAA